ncbi:MAG: cupredoxin domain-containing protein [Gemmatimonadaceae bacterium]|nr:cupredoxin domain-containing protein [Gemmatimonadaceae bacterium]
MTPTEWMVLAAGAGAIAWVNWYFFVAGRGTAVAAIAGVPGGGTGSGGVAEVTIAVQGGYSPATVRVKAGQPVRLVFDRQETSSCSEEIVIPDFGVKKFLPAYEKTTVEITPPKAGRYEFTCGMSMLRGAIVAEE